MKYLKTEVKKHENYDNETEATMEIYNCEGEKDQEESVYIPGEGFTIGTCRDLN